MINRKYNRRQCAAIRYAADVKELQIDVLEKGKQIDRDFILLRIMGLQETQRRLELSGLTPEFTSALDWDQCRTFLEQLKIKMSKP